MLIDQLQKSLFPYFPLDEKSAYYELSLSIEKENFIDFMSRIDDQRQNEMNEAIRQANEQSTASGADDDGMEALLVRKIWN